jgi:hypothetical protein
MSVTDAEIEAIRQRFRPARITTLFLGESRPASGRFFYRGNSGMTRHMRHALMPEAASDDAFLAGFKARGFFLDDLVLSPIDKMRRAERRARWRAALPAFLARLAEYQPGAVVVVLLGMQPLLSRAIRAAGHTMPVYGVPFPGQGNQGRFHAELGRLKLPRLPIENE